LDSIEKVKSYLNEKNCFDFDYTPKDGDRLIIKYIEDNQFNDLCFDYSTFSHEWELTNFYKLDDDAIFKQGKIKYI